MRKELITIYEYFPNYTKERVDKVLEQLTSEERRIIDLKIDTYNSGCFFCERMTSKEMIKFKRIVEKITRYLKSFNLDNVDLKRAYSKNPYQIFVGYTEARVKNVIDLLSDEEKSLLKLRFGEDYSHITFNGKWTNEQKQIYYNKILPKMKKELINDDSFNKKSRGPISIYRYFCLYSKNQIDDMLLKLNDQEKQLLNLKYGQNLECPRTSDSITDKQQRNFQILRTKMQRLLENPDVDADSYKLIMPEIYKFFRKYKMQHIELVVSNLTDREKRLLRIKFASAIDFYADKFMILIEKKDIKLLLIKIYQQINDIEIKAQLEREKKKQLFNECATTETYNYIVDLLHMPEYSFLLNNYSMKEAMVILLKFYSNEYITLKKISTFLGVPYKEVLKIYHNFLPNINQNKDERAKVYSLDTKNNKF